MWKPLLRPSIVFGSVSKSFSSALSSLVFHSPIAWAAGFGHCRMCAVISILCSHCRHATYATCASSVLLHRTGGEFSCPLLLLYCHSGDDCLYNCPVNGLDIHPLEL